MRPATALILIAFVGPARASIPSRLTSFVPTKLEKTNRYRAAGVFTGGAAGTGTSILAVRRSFSRRAALERVVVELGDREAKPPGERMGYFQAGLDPAGRRLTLDVSQLRLSKVTEAQLQRVFRESPYVRAVSYTFDPEDNAATMVLDLKRPVALEVFRTIKRGAPARIVMDLRARKVR